MNKHFISTLIFLAILLGACSTSVKRLSKNGYIKKTNEKVSSQVIKSADCRLLSSAIKGEEIKLNYLGCGGFAFQRGENTVLVDPYFSPVSVSAVAWSTLFGVKNLQSQENQIVEGLSPVFKNEANQVHSIWVSHSHYDHLMDVPYVFNRYPKSKKAKVYGSGSTYNILKSVIDEDQIKVVGSGISTYDFPNDKLRISSMVTSHAPHYRLLGIPISFFCGKAEADSTYRSELDFSKAGKWRLGQTYAFIFDYLDEQGEIEYRIFLQSSASYPADLADLSDLQKQHPFNLAILGAASFKYVNDYPDAIIKAIKPEKAIICHWEDFFVPFEKRKERVVRATNLKKYIANFHKQMPYLNQRGEEQFIIPKPGVGIRIEAGN